MKRNKLVDNLSFWTITIILVIVIYFLILKLLGKSPTMLQIISPLIIGLVFYVAKLGNDVSGIKGEFREFKGNVKESFVRVREDMGEMKKDIRQDLKQINDKLK